MYKSIKYLIILAQKDSFQGSNNYKPQDLASIQLLIEDIIK